jgi:hypothetical protein
MEKHDRSRLPVDSSLPKPVVLRPEDLACVAAAGAASAVLGTKPIIAGGLPASPYMSKAYSISGAGGGRRVRCRRSFNAFALRGGAFDTDRRCRDDSLP